VTHVYGADPLEYQPVRTDIHFDYSTPRRIFERAPYNVVPPWWIVSGLRE